MPASLSRSLAPLAARAPLVPPPAGSRAPEPLNSSQHRHPHGPPPVVPFIIWRVCATRRPLGLALLPNPGVSLGWSWGPSCAGMHLMCCSVSFAALVWAAHVCCPQGLIMSQDCVSCDPLWLIAGAHLPATILSVSFQAFQQGAACGEVWGRGGCCTYPL